LISSGGRDGTDQRFALRSRGRDLTPQLGDFFGARNGEGVLVRSIEKGSAAEAAGLKAGDVIVRVENERITDRGDWKTALRNHRRGKVSVGIIRDKKEQTISITIAEPKDDSSFEVMPFGTDETEEMDAHPTWWRTLIANR